MRDDWFSFIYYVDRVGQYFYVLKQKTSGICCSILFYLKKKVWESFIEGSFSNIYILMDSTSLWRFPCFVYFYICAFFTTINRLPIMDVIYLYLLVAMLISDVFLPFLFAPFW